MPSAPFTISLKSKVDGTRLTVGGTSNLPDGAKLTILLGREASFADDEGESRLFHLGGAGTEVRGGTVNESVEMDESKLADAVATGDFGTLQSVSDTITVCAQLRVADGDKPVQPEAVRAVVGKMGELLNSSPQMKKFGDETWLEAIEGVQAPSAALDELEAATGQRVEHGPSADELWCSS